MRKKIGGMDKNVKRARELRRDASRAERLCWEIVRAHRMDGVKFRRQHPIGPDFADIACVAKKLVIEIDGEQQHRLGRRIRPRQDSRQAAILRMPRWNEDLCV